MIAHRSPYRPPFEARSFVLQAALGCSWNNCTYCAMYRDQTFAVRPLEQSLAILDQAAAHGGVDKLFVADGDALVMDMAHWEPILVRARERLSRLRQVSCYATADGILAKAPGELARLRVGLHAGTALGVHTDAAGLDYFGGTVNLAARAVSRGADDEVVWTGAVQDIAGVAENVEEAGLQTPEFQAELKGLADPVTLYRVR